MSKYLDLLKNGKDAVTVVALAEQQIECQLDLLKDTLVYAFRYALGRSSYAVNDVCVAISSLKNELHEYTIELFKKEIKMYLDNSPKGHTQEWKDLLKELNNDPKSYSMSTLEVNKTKTKGE